jgi:methionyl-tRNA synthetase
MSKSLGNVVTPDDVLGRPHGVDLVRYYLLKDSRLDSDGGTRIVKGHCLSQAGAPSTNGRRTRTDFSEARLTTVAHELADTLGNLASRIMSLKLNPGQTVPSLNAGLRSCEGLLRGFEATAGGQGNRTGGEAVFC